MKKEQYKDLGTYYVDWLGEERPLIDLLIDDIYCKHESDYSKYHNNYRNQLIDLLYNTENKRFLIERERNNRLVEILKETGKLYPIAIFDYDKGFMCVDGHHRIMAHLTLKYDYIPAIIYNDCHEAGLAKANAINTDYYKDLMEIDKQIHKEN
uniref:ParB-like N-terminal domain-containing protein n=1 Tax=viral metagenome TaxID=1070528 RepID=A0A6M3L748_9ZZZZ